MHSYVLWRKDRDSIKTHIGKTKGTVSGSGKKPMNQKGSGKARLGNKVINYTCAFHTLNINNHTNRTFLQIPSI